MAYFDFAECGSAGSGEDFMSTGAMVEFALIHATGRGVPLDLVTAHKWFNIAASYGDKEAVRLRREIAADMSDAEIGSAQRAARDWLKAHPRMLPEATPLRMAA
jgi:TPR repeat protein